MFALVPHKEQHTLEVQFARSRKGNAVTVDGFLELRRIFDAVKATVTGCLASVSSNSNSAGGSADDGKFRLPIEDIRCVVLTGQGKHFCVGIDLSVLAQAPEEEDTARRGIRIREFVLEMQRCISTIDECPVPVVMGVHGACYGLGIDILCCADIRHAAKNTKFSVKEVDVGIVADMGTLQRLPIITGNHSQVHKWIYTGEMFGAEEARSAGLVSGELAADDEDVRRTALATAKVIAQKSPVVIYGIKSTLRSAHRSQVKTGLDYVATLNGFLVQTKDTEELVMQGNKKKGKGDDEPLVFSKL